MYAFEIPNLRFSMPAGEDIPRHRFVSVNSANGTAIVAEGITPVIGASMNRAEEGQVLEIADGIVMVEAGFGPIPAGSTLVSDSEGRAIDGEGSGRAIAITSANAAGELIAVKI